MQIFYPPERFFAFALVIALALLGCDAPETPGATTAPVRFRTSFDEVPTSLDPIKANSSYAGAIITNVYDTLYRYQLFTEPYALTPNLALAMPELSGDGKIVRIRLRTDAYFQDSAIFPGGKGRQVTAADVVYSLKRHFVPANFSDGTWLWLDNIEGIKSWVNAGAHMDADLSGLKAIAPDLLEIRLTQPMPLLTSIASCAPSRAASLDSTARTVGLP